jgi:type I restriction enzyme S subunit
VAKLDKAMVVPRLRFPDFREAEGWDLKHGDDLFGAINNRAPSESLPILAITQEHGAIPRGQIDYHVSVTEQSIESYKAVEKGDFIISLRSFQGGIEFSNYRGICSPAYVILRRKSKGSDGYFRHLFKSARFIQHLTRNIEGLRDGKMISYKQFSEQLIPVPKPLEQQKIADCLTSLDDVIAAQGRKVEALKTYKRGLMQQIFPREGETLPRLRFPEFRDAPEWKSEQLDTLAKRGSGHTPNKSITGYYNGGIKWISLADSQRLDKGLISQTATEISQQGLDNSSAVLHPAGSVVLSRDAGVGKSAVMGTPMAVSQHFIVWTCHSKRMSNWFLYYVLQKMKPVFERIATGSAIKTIGVPFFRDMSVMVPSLPEQQRIAESLSSLDTQIAAEADKLSALKTHKKGLMQQLFPSPEEA